MKATVIGGSGKMGRWLAGFLAGDGHQVIIYGRDKPRLLETAQKLGVEAESDLAKAIGNAEVIIISVPVDNFETVVQQLTTMIKPEQVVIDITSVKSKPVAMMQKYLGSASILGAHPVFGPGAKGVDDQNIVLTPTDEKESALAEKVKKYLEKRGARVSLMSPQEHDEMMAVVLGLAHFIAIVTADTLLDFKRLKQMEAIAGPTYKLLLTLAESVLSEDPSLYASLQINIPNLAEIESNFLKKSIVWSDIVKKGQQAEFVRRMNNLKEKMKQTDPDFGKAYLKMYRILEGSEQA